MQEAQLRRDMKQRRRDDAEQEPDQVYSIDISSTLQSVAPLEELSIAEATSATASSVRHEHPVDVSRKEQHSQHRTSVAKNRQKQLQTWAAARPTAPITSSYFTAPAEPHVQPHASSARVLLSGLGADELCGGYARYRTAFHRGGEAAARASMKVDVDRIWLRNLGRDDRWLLWHFAAARTSHAFHFASRIISDNSREMRTPYLDSSFITLLQQLPTALLINASAPSGVGDKIILRRVAANIGLVAASQRPKRAIQFGCRIAKQLNRTFFGASCSGSGTAIVAGPGGD